MANVKKSSAAELLEEGRALRQQELAARMEQPIAKRTQVSGMKTRGATESLPKSIRTHSVRGVRASTQETPCCLSRPFEYDPDQVAHLGAELLSTSIRQRSGGHPPAAPKYVCAADIAIPSAPRARRSSLSDRLSRLARLGTCPYPTARW